MYYKVTHLKVIAQWMDISKETPGCQLQMSIIDSIILLSIIPWQNERKGQMFRCRQVSASTHKLNPQMQAKTHQHLIKQRLKLEMLRTH